MPTLLDTLRSQFETNQDQMSSILSRYADEGQELSDTDAANMTDLKAANDRLKDRIAELAAIDSTSAELDQIMGRRQAAMSGGLVPMPGNTPRPTSLGRTLIDSAEFSRWKAQGMDGASSEVASEFALVTSKDTNGEPIGGTARVRDAALPSLVTPILDSFSVEATDKNDVWWLEYPSASPEAGTVAEGTPMGEATYAPIVRTGSAEAWKHSIPLTEEAMEDEARLESIVGGALMNGVRKKAEKSAGGVLTGTTGYLTVGSVTDMIQGARLAIAKLQESPEQYLPSHVYINPADYADVDLSLLERTLNGAVKNNTPWGLIYVPTPYVTAGTLYVADAAAAFLFIDRRQVRLSMTDSHASEFVDDVYRVKATARGKTVCQRKDAVVKVTKAAAVAEDPEPAAAKTRGK